VKKRTFIIGLVIALLVSLVPASAAFAVGPTPFEPVSVDIDWDGGGEVGATVVGGDDATTEFWTGGNHVAGTFTAGYTPGSYSYMEVNTLVSRIDATVAGGGWINYRTERTDCYGGWSPAGQVSYSRVWTDDGNASMGFGSKSHLNGLIDYNYPKQGTLAVDSATSYEIIRSLSVDDILVEAWAVGSGSATLQNRNSAIDYQFAPSGAELGGYSGCPPTDTFHAVGSGTFSLLAKGANGAIINDTDMTGSTSGSLSWLGDTSFSGSTVTATDVGLGAALHIIANFASNFDMGDYSIRGW